MNAACRILIPASVLLAFVPTANAETIAVTGATVHTMGPEGTIENATIVIRDGLFESVGRDVSVPPDAASIDAAGRIITPGLFTPMGHLGLTEVSAVEETVDYYQVGERYSAAFDVAPAYNPRSALIAINRAGGVTRALTAPAPGFDDEDSSGQIFSGLAAVVQLGDTAPYAVESGAALVVNFGEQGGMLAGGSRAAALMAFRTALDDAIDYRRNKDAYERGQRREYSLSMADLDALQPVIAGRTPVIATVNRAADIESLLDVVEAYRLALVVYGGAEAWMVADRLAAAGAAVILDPTGNLPQSFDQLNASLEAPARLARAGVTIAFGGNAQNETYAARNATQAAGNAVANGLPWLEGLAAITLAPARMYRVDDRLGSIEPGKEADLVVWAADPLELTSNPEKVMIRGAWVSLENRQTLLRDRYLDSDSGKRPAFRH